MERLIVEINPELHSILFNYTLKPNEIKFDGSIHKQYETNKTARCPYDKELCAYSISCIECKRYIR